MASKHNVRHAGRTEVERDAIFYCRVSDKHQEDGYSLDAQREMAVRYAAQHGLKIIEEIVTVESAWNPGREDFQRVYDIIRRSKKPMALIVEKTDRLARNMQDGGRIRELMKELDLQLHLPKEGAVLTKDSPPTVLFGYSMNLALAEYHSNNVSHETRKGLDRAARVGDFPHKPPAGYLRDPANGEIIFDPALKTVILDVFQTYAKGAHSFSELAAHAREQGLNKTRATIERMLLNPFYCGQFFWKGQLYDGNHPPLVSRDLFDKVQAVRVARGNSGTKQTRKFAFAGLLACHYCGCKFTTELQKGKYVFYRCTGRRGPCQNKYVREDVLAQRLGLALKGLAFDPRLYETFKASLKATMADQKKRSQDEAGRLQDRAKQLQDRLHNLLDDRVDGLLDARSYSDAKRRYETELNQVQAKLAACARDDRETLTFGLYLIELAQTAYQAYLQRSPHDQRELLDYVCLNFELTESEAIPTYRKPFDLIASAGALTKKGTGLNSSEFASCPVRGG